METLFGKRVCVFESGRTKVPGRILTNSAINLRHKAT